MKVIILFDNDIDKNVVGVFLRKICEDQELTEEQATATHFENHEVIE